MSRSSRKRSSKWDLPEEPQFEDANIPDDGWMGKAGRPFHHKESGREWHSPELGGSNASKWSGLETNDMQRSKRGLGLPSREALPGSRSSHRNESISKGGSRYTEDSMVWDEDGNCSTRMSPGLDEWRQHRSRSPKSGWSRSLRVRSRSRSWTRSRSQSWSRSPDRGYRRESVFLDRNRSRSGVSAQVCKDFAGGRCRRGSDCQLLHEGNSSYDDSWEGRHRNGSASKYSTPPVSGDNPLKTGRSSVYGNDFINGKSRREASSKFDNHRVSDGFSKGSANEIIRERDNDRERDSDRRRRDASTERGVEREPRRSGDIPCKFFAAGNCRNKKFCRFSHHIQSHASSERRSRDDRWGLGHSLNDTDQAWNGRKWNDTPSDSAKLSPDNTGRPRDGRWALGHKINDADQEWDGQKWSDTVTLPESAKLGADNNGNIGVPELRSSAWSMNDNSWGRGLNNENQMCGDPSVSHEAAKRNEKEAQLWKGDKVGAKSKDTEKWLGDMSPDWNYTLQSSNIGKEEHGHIRRGSEISRINDTSLNACKQDMSPDWNYTLQTSNNISREEHGHSARGSESSRLNDTSLKAGNQDIIREASVQVHGGASVMQPMIAERSNYLQNQDIREGGSIGLPHDGKNAIDRTASSRTDLNVSANIMSHQSFDHNVQSSTASPFPGMNTIGQSQALIPAHTQGGLVNPQDTLSGQRKSVIKLDIGDSKTSLVTGLPPVPNVVGGKDLTQLTSLSVSLAQLLENGHQLPQLYAALNSHNALNAPPFPKSEGSSEQLSAIQPEPAMLSQKPYDPTSDTMELKKQEHNNNKACLLPNSTGKTGVDGKLEKPSDDYHQIRNSVEEPRRKSHQLNQPDGNNELGVEESKKVEEENNSPENGPLEVADKDGADEGKKLKEVKGIRAFKFALAEFVKDLLKPSWKDGQVSKDAYKTIVKKVVDKVTGTIPGANIPQTQEKIDSYLSFSKPKLTKLVQAYVEKMQKG
ncbi:putative transcription factor C3H family [Rosa chinensis]|uniref:Putative transcription factor C3H family n=1 Tax=Rosa chinensis TaxID=74649 RepID=A0A2P6RSC0_ROSCH|nr:zinc finger CCCH domain-containing protein 38 isoform X1 [Rosa chinensis]XP_024179738.1 zinc finger CCCH domain-containing protein 38 isoform X1 [Rosa chinensis]PRQ49291.1 putative transcription factor C3H family [Rosa chinensis]